MPVGDGRAALRPAAGVNSAHRVRARWVLRRHLNWTVLAVLVGVVGGGLIAAAAGAHRTATVHERFLEATNAADVFVLVGCGQEPADTSGGCGDRPPAELLAELGSVSDTGVLASMSVPVTTTDGVLLNPRDDACASGTGELIVIASRGATASGVNRVQVTEGRPPDPADASSVLVSKPFADRAGLSVGDQLAVYLGAGDCFDESDWGEPALVRVDGIGIMQAELVPEQGYYFEGIHLSAAASEGIQANSGGSEAQQEIVGVVLAGGSSLDDLEAEASSAGLIIDTILDRETLASGVTSRYRVDVTMLNLVAGIGFVGAAFVLGAALMRQAAGMAADARVLIWLGWVRRDLLRVGLSVGTAVAVVASAVSVITAMVLSTIMPFGEAGVLEPDKGLRLDLLRVLSGVLMVGAIVLLSFAIGTWLSVRSQLTPTPRPAERTAADRAVAAFPMLPVSAVTGWRMATQRSPSAGDVPLRTSVAAIVIGLVGIVGSLTFVSGLDHLLSTDRLVGWNWDQLAFIEEDGESGEPVSTLSPDEVLAGLAGDPGVQGVAGIGFLFWRAEVFGPEGDPVLGISFTAGSDLGPTIIDGREPEGPHEIAVSPAALDRYQLEIGEALELTAISDDVPTSEVSYEIVGTTVLPLDDGNLTSAAALTHEGASRLVSPGEEFSPDAFVLDLVGGTSLAEIADRSGLPISNDGLEQPDPGGLIGLNTERNRRAPVALVAILGVMLLGLLAHLVVTMVTRRRRDLAILRTLGYTNGQTRATMAWGVTLVTAMTILVALPVGYIVGRAIWLDYAASLSVFPESQVPWMGALAVTVCVLVVVNIAALAAGHRAARIATMTALRPE